MQSALGRGPSPSGPSLGRRAQRPTLIGCACLAGRGVSGNVRTWAVLRSKQGQGNHRLGPGLPAPRGGDVDVLLPAGLRPLAVPPSVLPATQLAPRPGRVPSPQTLHKARSSLSLGCPFPRPRRPPSPRQGHPSEGTLSHVTLLDARVLLTCRFVLSSAHLPSLKRDPCVPCNAPGPSTVPETGLFVRKQTGTSSGPRSAGGEPRLPGSGPSQDLAVDNGAL